MQDTTRIMVPDLRLAVAPDEEIQEGLKDLLAKKLNIAGDHLPPYRIIKRAIDARRNQPAFVFCVTLDLESRAASNLLTSGKALEYKKPFRRRWHLSAPLAGPPPVVVGAGPAGLFAALTLAEAGCRPILLERGEPVEARGRKVSKLYARGTLDPNSNVCFGEGGAGTYSDGKLYTRVNDSRGWGVVRTLVELGAPARLEVDNRPHIGTDRLVVLLKGMRQRLLDLGASIRFGTKVEALHWEDGQLRRVMLDDGESIDAPRTLLATGHSARKLMRRLYADGAPIEAAPFAVGFRVEHSQDLINRIRYGRASSSDLLPAADYSLRHQGQDGRGVYSFCMCPGGVVVATPTEEAELCINGMSHASRSGRFANSALVVALKPTELESWGYSGVFGGVDFQQDVEQAAYQAGGGDFVAPASRLTDFLQGRVSGDLSSTSYRRGIVPADLATLYPTTVIEALQQSLNPFAKRMPGFLTEEATLIGVETRTASPLRCLRDETGQALGIGGLYPSGEGLGYGGGIASAAIDGVRAAEHLLQELGATFTEEELPLL